MPLTTAIERASFEELLHILGWIADQRLNPERLPGVLVGGWAVYAYNPYLGSIDIDLVVSGNMRKRLSRWLCQDRGFHPTRGGEPGWEGVFKDGPDGHKIIADFANRNEDYHFQGRPETLNFDIVDGHTEARLIETLEVLVPERALLVLFKIKAAYDREVRLATGSSDDADWERGKLVKDQADILALLDPAAGGNDLSVGFLGATLAQYPFLVPPLRSAGKSSDAIKRYGRMSLSAASQRIIDVVNVVT